jgi:hypothetical protein
MKAKLFKNPLSRALLKYLLRGSPEQRREEEGFLSFFSLACFSSISLQNQRKNK